MEMSPEGKKRKRKKKKVTERVKNLLHKKWHFRQITGKESGLLYKKGKNREEGKS